MSISGRNSCPQSKSSLISRLINGILYVNQTLPQLINISHKMLTYPLLSCSSPKILLSTGLKSDMLRSHRFGAVMKSGVSRRSSWMVETLWAHDVLARCAVKLKPVLCFRLYEEYEISFRWEICLRICLPKTIKIDLGLTNLLQK